MPIRKHNSYATKLLTAFTAAILIIAAASSAMAETRTITDMRGKQVTIPANPQRVITLDDGFCEGIMTALGVQDAVLAVGSHCAVKIFKYTYPTTEGEEYAYIDGMNPVGYLNPRLRDVPQMATYGKATNYEELARLQPDLVFMRVGSCYSRGDKEILGRQMRMVEAMGIPLVVLNGPPTYCNPTIEHISEEIRIVGEVFGKEQQAVELANYLESIVNMVRERTAKVEDKDRPSVLLFGLSPKARGEGGAGTVQGKDTIESYFLENIIKARNAFDGTGSFSVINAEHVFAMDPDVIILPTAWGYHPPKELYTAPYYAKLASLSAVKNRRVVALPWTPCNCAKRIEYPIEIMVMAKAAHPELFKDISIHEWVLDFYKKVYGVDDKTAKGLRSTQWLDWTVEEQW